MEISQHKRKTLLIPCLFITKIFLLFLSIPAGATSITFNYEKFLDVDLHNLNLEEDVFLENGMLNLTRYKKQSQGRVTYKNLLQLWDNETRTLANFTTRFIFIINAQNGTNGKGDGITFFLAHPNFPLPVPPGGSGIGLVGSNNNEHPFVAVEFDTYHNVDMGDPNYDHVGINVKQMWTNFTTQWYTMNDGRKYEAEIRYNSNSQQLTVNFTGVKDNVSIQQSYSHEIDFRDYLPQQVQFGFSSSTGFGFSSATGSEFEYHTLCSWSFNSSAATLGVLKNSKGNKSNGNKGLIIGLSIGSFVVIGGLGLAWSLIWKSNCRVDRSLDRDFKNVGPKKIPYNKIKKATNNFAIENELGKGGFGVVYKGYFEETKRHAAIKKISQGSRQGLKEYKSEVETISQLRHKNLVQLIGWCHKHDDLMLVYEFMENRSLDYHLFKGKSPLTWEQRYNIAQGLASALFYLHKECKRERCVVHRDIKASNVLLDSNFNAKLGDFGLARLVDHSKGSKTTDPAGTFGYMDLEYARVGNASRETDMYSFGVVALEIACGRKAIEHENGEPVLLVEWVWEHHSGDVLKAADQRLGTDSGESVLEAADKRLGTDFDKQQMLKLMMIGLWCVRQNRTERPTAETVVQVLNPEAPLPDIQLQKPTSSNNSNALVTSSSGASASRSNHTSLPVSDVFHSASSPPSTSAQVISPSPASLLHTY